MFNPGIYFALRRVVCGSAVGGAVPKTAELGRDVKARTRQKRRIKKAWSMKQRQPYSLTPQKGSERLPDAWVSRGATDIDHLESERIARRQLYGMLDVFSTATQVGR